MQAEDSASCSVFFFAIVIQGLMFSSVGKAKVFSHFVLLLSPGGIDRLSSSAILVLKKKN